MMFDLATLATVAYTMTSSQLPANNVGALMSDRQGGIWIGTAGGFARFDGTTWRDRYTNANSPLRSQDVHSMLVDKVGALWLITNDGLYRYDSLKWARFTVANSGLPEVSLTSLATDPQGNIWVGTANSGIAIYDGRITSGAPPLGPPADGGRQDGDALWRLNLY